ncbi:MAG: hypothetical protein PVI23_15995 [Maricaulaceae bacterium]|jgi:hypothetical protein
MTRCLILALGAAMISVPALAEGGETASENPHAVVWDGDLREALPITLQFTGAYSAETAPLQLDNPTTDQFDAATLARPGASPWRNQASLDVCAAAGACEDVGISEHVGVRLRSDGESVRLGALVRFGEELSEERAGEGGWQFFAAADAHALTWSPNSREGEAVRVREQRLLGDAQAGITRSVYGGDLAFGFVHREISYKGAKAEEQFGGVTFVLTR